MSPASTPNAKTLADGLRLQMELARALQDIHAGRLGATAWRLELLYTKLMRVITLLENLQSATGDSHPRVGQRRDRRTRDEGA